jgi:hypothetical protein
MAILLTTLFRDLIYTLAPEIRNEIYGYVFLIGDDRINTSVRNPKHFLALLRTCKQYHQEATSFFYTRYNFHFSSSAIRLAHQVPISTMLPPISDRYIHFLKRVTLSISVGDPSLTDTRTSANLISALMRTGAQFEEVCIKLTPGRYLELSLTRISDDGILDSNHCIVSALQSLFHSNICKEIQINVQGCYFAPGVASHLFDTFQNAIGIAQDRKLSFWKGDKKLDGDLSACERELTGNSYHSLIWDSYLRDDDGEAGDEKANESSKSSNAVTFAEIVDLNLDYDLDFGMDEDETAVTKATSLENEEYETYDPNTGDDFDWQALLRQGGTRGLQSLVLFAPELL